MACGPSMERRESLISFAFRSVVSAVRIHSGAHSISLLTPLCPPPACPHLRSGTIVACSSHERSRSRPSTASCRRRAAAGSRRAGPTGGTWPRQASPNPAIARTGSGPGLRM
jgi:hypothetical protein